MISKIERVFATELFGDLRKAYISRARLESRRIASSRKWMQANGFELLDVHDDARLTSDGREIMRALGRAWALLPEVHASRRDAAIEKAQHREVERRAMQAPVVTESIAATTCPQMINGKPCGGTLNRAAVCPSCVTGRMGYKYRYTCESCGFDIATKQGLSE